MKKKILIYDDDSKQQERFGNKLKKAFKNLGQDRDFDIDPLREVDLPGLIEKLQTRQTELRETRVCSGENIAFDDIFVFIIDYDLLKSTAGGFFTGENLAYSVSLFYKLQVDCRLKSIWR